MRKALSVRTQQGAGLIVALIFLAVLTIAGITAARLTNMEERMAGNIQFRGLTYQNAQSEIRAQMAAYNTNLVGRKPLLDAANQGADAISGFPDRRQALAVTAILSNANIATNTIRYMNKGICEGSSVGKFECSAYEINSASRLDNGASSNQVQGIYFINAK
ncbi:pilus assembly PilX family protein [Pseudomonas citronellolis]|jgi:Tfp pilus assembly protein PilX|uniref:pilus assembly PilX family protein n=1 Tax=Pseudomonas citronellolis TaxID=53408 RepID=UPI003C2B49E5